MKFFRISVAILWVILNIITISFLLLRQEKSGYCAESYPPQCHTSINFGWPKTWLSVQDDSKTFVHKDNARVVGLATVLFFTPSLTVAFLLGKGVTYANSRH